MSYQTGLQTPLLQAFNILLIIQIPLKKTDAVDFASPFASYIQEAYQDDPSNYQGELDTLNRLV
jgi:hypothetical protein